MNTCHYDKRMDFFYNQTNTHTEEEWSGTKLIIVLCFGACCCFFIFISNLMVIAAVIINKRFHFPFYYLLANLAAADFFAGIAYVFLMFHTGPVSKTLTVHRWFLRQGLLDTSMSASLANLLVIAVERHMSIVRMRIHSNLTKKRVTFLILSIWAIAILMGAVPTLGWNCICNIASCSSLAPIYSRSYLTFWTVLNLAVFVIMLVVYLRIYMYVQRKTNVLSPHTSGSISRRRTPIKLMKTVMAVLGQKCFTSALICLAWYFRIFTMHVRGFRYLSSQDFKPKGAFVICWTPGLVVLLLDGLNCTRCGVQHVKRWFLLLALMNSIMNPIIYSYKDEEMWRTFKKMICCFFNNRRERHPSRMSSTVHSTRSTDTTSQYLEEVNHLPINQKT